MRMGDDGHALGTLAFDQLRRIAQGLNGTGGAGERQSFGLGIHDCYPSCSFLRLL